MQDGTGAGPVRGARTVSSGRNGLRIGRKVIGTALLNAAVESL